ncbi:MAG: hypothetical protein JWO59_2860 [Chloroflexi bacterium]|nr:hypothetical protein [Chloroflexota bacterium]
MPAGEWMTITSMRRWCELNNITDAAELSLEAQDIRVLAFPLAMRSALKGAGVCTVGQLVAKPWPEVWAIAGIDAAGIEHMQLAVRRFVFGAIEDRFRQVRIPITFAPVHRRAVPRSAGV